MVQQTVNTLLEENLVKILSPKYDTSHYHENDILYPLRV